MQVRKFAVQTFCIICVFHVNRMWELYQFTIQMHLRTVMKRLHFEVKMLEIRVTTIPDAVRNPLLEPGLSS